MRIVPAVIKQSAVAASESTPSNKHHSVGASFFRRRRDRSGEGSDLEGGKEHPSRRKMLKKLNREYAP